MEEEFEVVEDSRAKKQSTARGSLFGGGRRKARAAAAAAVVELDIVETTGSSKHTQYASYGDKSRQEYVQELDAMDAEALRLAEDSALSTKRTRALVHETREVGTATATALNQQSEQLERIQDDLVETNATIDRTDKIIQKLASPWTYKLQPGARRKKEDQLKSSGMNRGRVIDLDESTGLEIVSESVSPRGSGGGKKKKDAKVLEQEEREALLSPRTRAKQEKIRKDTAHMTETERRLYILEQEQDDDLNDIGKVVGDLKGLALAMNTELNYQTEMIVAVTHDAGVTSRRLKENNRKVKNI
ncbi:Synaptosomal-associated protein 25-B [Porphyridium purpureum]|uniref:Synaptosomal-associated protein 25-B n=1 Tax=Porphyridium purpureum TaxID=35688 RepID=A0A5J4Z0K1_PORPP|nr:Synaptosomal-associated protein 25-B [Porphyridium purpureum]|eukprot:POR9068..scf208_2